MYRFQPTATRTLGRKTYMISALMSTRVFPSLSPKSNYVIGLRQSFEHTQAYTHTRTHTRAHIHKNACTNTHTHLNTNTYTHAYTHTRTHTHKRTRACTLARTHAHKGIVRQAGRQADRRTHRFKINGLIKKVFFFCLIIHYFDVYCDSF